MEQRFAEGDFLVFQVEAGFGIMRVLGTDEMNGSLVWHVAAYDDLFMDVDGAETAAAAPEKLSVNAPHIAMTNRAFESTQVSRIANSPLTEDERNAIRHWRSSRDGAVGDRSIRLLLGLR